MPKWQLHRAFVKILILCLTSVPHSLEQLMQMSLVPITKTIKKESVYKLEQFTLSIIPAQSSYKLDFSKSDITMPDGPLTTCQYIANSVTTDLSQCSCTSKVCTIVSQVEMKPFVIQINLGPLTNPGSLSDQTIIGSLNNGSEDSISISADKYTPGVLTKVSMSQSSQKVAEFNDMILIFKLSNNIPKQGQIRVVVPLGDNDQDMQLSKQVTLDMQVYHQPLIQNVNILYDQTTITIKGTNSAFTSETIADNDKQISLKVKQIRNPTYLKTSQTSISIYTLTSDGKTIDQILTGFQAGASESSQLAVGSVTTLSTIVNTLTTYSIELQPSVVFQSGGKLVIQLPSELEVVTGQAVNSQCTILIGLASVNEKTGSCIYKGNQIFETSDYYYPSTATYIKIQLTLILNNPSTKPSSSFQFIIYNEFNQILCQHYPLDIFFTPTPAIMSFSSLPSRSNNNPNEVTTLSLAVTLINRLTKNGYIRVVFNKNYFLSIDTNTYKCYYLDSNNNQQLISPCDLTQDSSSMTLQFIEFCSVSQQYCEVGTVLSVVFTSLTNVVYVPDSSSSSELVVDTLTPLDSGSVYQIDRASTSISPASNPYGFSNVVFSRLSSNVAGETSQLEVSIEDSQYSLLQTNNGDLSISLPESLFCMQTGVTSPICQLKTTTTNAQIDTCTVTYYPQTSQQMSDIPCQSIKSILLDNMCSTSNNQCELLTGSSGTFSIVVSSVINYMALTSSSGVDSYQVTLKDLTSSKTLQKSTIESLLRTSITIGSFKSISITSSSYQTAQIASYTLSILLGQSIPITSKIIITLADSNTIQTQTNTQCTITINTKSITSDVSSNSFTIDLSSLFSSEVLSTSFIDKPLSILITNVVNPSSLKPVSSIKVQTTTSDDKAMQEQSTTLTMLTTTEFKAVSLIRDSQQFNNNVKLSVNLQLYSFIRDSSHIISIRLIKSQVVIDKCSAIKVTDKNSQKTLTITVITDDTTTCEISTTMTYCPCLSTSQTYTVILQNGLTNPSNGQGQESLSMVNVKTSDGYLVSRVSPKISPVLTGGSLTLVSILPTSSPVSTYTSIGYTVTIKLKTTISSGGYIQLIFPDKLLYFQGTSTVTVNRMLSTSTLPITTESTFYTVDTSIKFINTVKLTNICEQTDSCQADAQIVFLLSASSLKSYYSTRLIQNDGTIQIQSLDNTNSILDTSSTDLKSFECTEAGHISSSVSFGREGQGPFQIVSVEVSLMIDFLLPKDSLLIITFSTSQITLIDDNTNRPQVYPYDSQNIKQSLITSTIIQSTSTFSITFTEFCSQSQSFCPLNTKISFQIGQLKNTGYVAISSDPILMTIHTGSTNEIIRTIPASMNVQLPLVVQSQFTNPAISLSQQTVGMSTRLLIQIQLLSPISTSDLITVTLSTPGVLLDANKCQVAYAVQLDSNQIYYNAVATDNCLINLQDSLLSTVTLKGICSQDGLCDSGDKLIIALEGIAQLYEGKASGTLTIRSLTSASQVFSESSLSLESLEFKAYDIPELTVTRSSSIISTPVVLTLSMNLPIVWRKDSHLLVDVPRTQLDLVQNYNVILCNYLKSDATGTDNSEAIDCQLTSTSDNIYILLKQGMCASETNGNCPSGYSLILQFSNAFQNPKQQLISSIDKQIQLKSFYPEPVRQIFQFSGIALILPSLDTSNTISFQVTRTNPLIQQTDSKYHISFQIIKKFIATDQLVISFPPFMIYKQSTLVVNRIEDVTSLKIITIQSMTISTTYIEDSYKNEYLNTLTIKQFCASQCVDNQVFGLQLSNFVNPLYMTSSVNQGLFIIRQVNSESQIMAQKQINANSIMQNLQGYSLKDVSASRDNTSPDTSSTLTIQFETTFQIEQSSLIVIIIPTSQFQLTNQMITGNSISSGSSKVISSLGFQANSTYTLITLTEYCSNGASCPSGTKIHMTIGGLKNSQSCPSNNYSNNLQIIIQKDSLRYYAHKDDIPINPISVSALIISDFKVKRMINDQENLVGIDVILRLSFTLPDSLKQESSLQLAVQFPSFAFYQKNDLSYKSSECSVLDCKMSLNNNKGHDQRRLQFYIDTIVFTYNPISQSSSTVQIELTLGNQLNTFDYFSNSVTELKILDSNGLQKTQGQQSNTLPAVQPNTFTNCLMSGTNYKVQQTGVTVYLFIYLKNSFSSQEFNGRLDLTLSGYIQTIQPTSIYIHLPKLKHIIFSYKQTDNTMSISYQDSQLDLTNYMLQIEFIGVTNPMSNLEMVSQVTVTSYSSSSIQIDSSIYSELKYQMKALGSLTTSIKRSNIFSRNDTSIQLYIQTTHVIPKGGDLQLILHKQQLVSNSQQTKCSLSCVYYDNSMTIQDICKQQNCPAGSEFNISINRGLRNADIAHTEAILKDNYYGMIMFTRDASGGQIDSAINVIAQPMLIQTYLQVYEVGSGVYYWLVVVLGTVYLTVNGCVQKQDMNRWNSILVVYQVVESGNRLVMTCVMLSNKSNTGYVQSGVFLALAGTPLLGIMYVQLYLGLYITNLKYFSSYHRYHTSYVNTVSILISLFGVFMAQLFQSGLKGFQKNQFHLIKPYRNTLYVQRILFIIISRAIVICVYLYVLAVNIHKTNSESMLAIIGILLNAIIVVSWLIIKKRLDEQTKDGNQYKNIQYQYKPLVKVDQEVIGMMQDEEEEEEEENNNDSNNEEQEMEGEVEDEDEGIEKQMNVQDMNRMQYSSQKKLLIMGGSRDIIVNQDIQENIEEEDRASPEVKRITKPHSNNTNLIRPFNQISNEQSEEFQHHQ